MILVCQNVSSYFFQFLMSHESISKLCESELLKGPSGSSSWHYAYSDSAYIYIGGFEKELTEGDIVIAFSQFGEVVDINLVRDPTSGESKGFCFLAYADQRSTIIAIDNMNGCPLYKRILKVDHVKDYKVRAGDIEYTATGAEGAGLGVKVFAESERQTKQEHVKKQVKDEDEEWAEDFEKTLKSDKFLL